jgi:hypothetical protein
MGKFEYKTLLGTRKAVDKELNQYAQEGWEPIFFSATSFSIFFMVAVLLRRPLER